MSGIGDLGLRFEDIYFVGSRVCSIAIAEVE